MDLKFHRQSIRLPNHDYSSKGWYYITICTHQKELIFGEIVDGKMILNEFGQIANNCWIDIPKHFINTCLGEFVIMPNHVHGIIVIINVGVGHAQPLRQNHYQHMIPNSICSIVNSYKSAVTKLCKRHSFRNFIWQRNYWEHIIHDDDDLKRIKRYIENNPAKWDEDRNNPKNIIK